jgi:hypothetical protein
MKTFIFVLCLLLKTKAALAVVMLPPAADTNQLAEIYRASSINAALNNGYYCIGRMDRLSREVDRLECGFLIAAVLIGSTFMSLSLLAVRDRIRECKPTRQPRSEIPMDDERYGTDSSD